MPAGVALYLHLAIDWLVRINKIIAAIILVLTSVAASVAVTTVVSQVPQSPVTNPVAAEPKIVIAPATGVEGFDAALFCADPLTSVRALPAPDASGVTYQLTRVRDAKAETVVVVLGSDRSIVLATHYYDSAIGQQSEPAIVSGVGRECIERKAKT